MGIAEAVDILGHSETRTAQRYLRRRLDDQKNALAKRGDYLRGIEAGMIRDDHRRKNKEGVGENPRFIC